MKTGATALAGVVLLLAGCTGSDPNGDGGAGGTQTGNAGGAPTGDVVGGTGAPADACAQVPSSFTTAVAPKIDATCRTCHVAGGVAGGTRLLFAAGGGTAQTWADLKRYAQVDVSLLLSKSIGVPAHAGGAPLGDANAQAYKDLAALVPELTRACTTITTAAAAVPFWSGVTMASDATVLAKGAALFAGRNPTAQESAAVGSGGGAALRQALRGYMQGPAFDRFLDDAGDTHFLTPGVPVFGTGGLNATDWPNAAMLINNDASLPAGERNRFQTAFRREPVEMMKYVVNKDRPWTDMVSGNYTVVNGLIAKYLGARVTGTFVDPNNDTEWLPAVLPSQRLGGDREHAGVLSSHAWLSRFPTTATNRNRHRILAMSQQFLATDVAALAVRPLNADVSAFKVPTVENPACAACHDTIDPMAAGFQNWNEANRYLPNKTGAGKDHALPGSYRSNNYPKDAAGQRFYVDGDNWFRDEKAPGYGSVAMPGGVTGNPTALQWLGGQVAGDPRFALGAVHFWYEAVFGRKPMVAPGDPAAPQYAAQLAAFNAQKAEFDTIAQAFTKDRGAGAYNVKDLLIDLLTSNHFRAERMSQANAARAAELSEVGSANLLLPTQLNLKLQNLVGAVNPDFNNPYAGFALTYTDFDGRGRDVRAKSFTMMQTITIDRMVAMRSCGWTQGDFNKPQGTRLLFPQVALTDTPGTPAGTAAITANVQYLHRWLLKEDLAPTDPEIQRTVKLFTDVWNDRATPSDKALTCSLNNTNDPNYTGRSWAVVLGYLLGDPKFLYE